jgi:hypothetical protein
MHAETDTQPSFNKIFLPESILMHPAWRRLDDQYRWYERKSATNQKWYKRLKMAQMTLAVSIPILSLLPGYTAKYATAVSGALIALLESVQQTNQFAMLWINYRSTAERLGHEKHLFLGAAGPYRGLSEADRLLLLTEHVEDILASEHLQWRDEIQLKAIKEKP